jgi:hypothetical protein
MSNPKYDWYLSPKDRFEYETAFNRFNTDLVTLQQLDPLFKESQVETNEFIQMFQLVDIRHEFALNQIQFVYFMHCLKQRKRGFEIPVGLPLDIKQQFLKEQGSSDSLNSLVNTRTSARASITNAKELQNKLKSLEEFEKVIKFQSTMHYRREFRDLLTDLTLLKMLLNEL